jgi:anti-sigma B factor antagonist
MEKESNVKKDGTTLYVKLDFELSTANASDLKDELNQYKDQDIQKIVYDFTDMVYLSSAGIRVILFSRQNFNKHPILVFVNCAKEIRETLELTGISNIINFDDDDRNIALTDGKSADDVWQEKIAKTRQRMLDHFAASNDVVMFQMKLGEEDN